MHALRARMPELVVSVSATTRSPRGGELDGRDYHFLTDGEFTRRIEQGELLEWAEFAGRRYGTPWSPVQQSLLGGHRVVLEIEVNGALQVRERDPSATLIFLSPPSLEVLAQRLETRGTDEAQVLAERSEIARRELADRASFDHVVVDHTVDETVEALARIVGQSDSPARSRGG